jgi:hypothetical protein
VIAGRHVAAILAGILAFAAAGLALAWLWASYAGMPISPFAQTLIALGLPPAATFSCVGLIGVRWCGLRWADLGFRRVRLVLILRAVGVWLLCLPAVGALVYLMFRITGSSAIGRQVQLIPSLGSAEPWQIPILAALIVGAAPLAEEILFRGLLFGWLRRHVSFWPSAFASALVFSLLHMIVEVIPPTIALGLVFAWMYERSGSLWTPIAVHMLHNGLVLGTTITALERGLPLAGP